ASITVPSPPSTRIVPSPLSAAAMRAASPAAVVRCSRGARPARSQARKASASAERPPRAAGFTISSGERISEAPGAEQVDADLSWRWYEAAGRCRRVRRAEHRTGRRLHAERRAETLAEQVVELHAERVPEGQCAVAAILRDELADAAEARVEAHEGAVADLLRAVEARAREDAAAHVACAALVCLEASG